jgi:putative ABC transport system permease protein
VVALAGIGVFSTLLTQARERVRDLGIHKALGMTPRQVITMVICWAVAPAIIAAAVALPAGAALEPVVARAIVSAQAGPAESNSPLIPGGDPGAAPRNARQLHTQRLRNGHQAGRPAPGMQGFFSRLFNTARRSPYTPGELALLGLAGLVIAIAGALGPAVWAAASRTTSALRAE